MDDKKKIAIDLTVSQITSLADFIEFNFIQSIRDDTDVDSMVYVSNICEAYTKFKKALEDHDAESN